MPTVTLIGYRGTGKSTVAAVLARRLECRWWDADVELERTVGMSIATLIGEQGEPRFRDEEVDVLRGLLAQPRGVLATGGGAVLRAANRAGIRESGGMVVWLTAPADVIRRRLASDPTTASRRPGLTGTDPLAEIDAALAARDPLYRECAHECVDTSAASTDEVVAAIVRALERRNGPDASPTEAQER